VLATSGSKPWQRLIRTSTCILTRQGLKPHLLTERYKPAFSEEFQKQVDYSPTASRKSLLAQKTFIVFSAPQLNHLSGLIPLAGGFVEHYEGFTSLRTVDGRTAAVRALESYCDGFESPCMVKLRGVSDDSPIAQVVAQVAERYLKST
jgi:hypothetical protein